MELMGVVCRVLSFTRAMRNGARVSDTKSNPGGGANLTGEHFSAPGDDSYPLSTDYVYKARGAQAGRFVSIGYLDPLNTPKAQKGDKRIYARDATTGAVVVEVWLKNDGAAIIENAGAIVTVSPNGSILGSNSAGRFELENGGDFVANGVTIKPGGIIEGVTSLTAGDKELVDHTHPAGTPPGNTGVNN